MEPVEEDRAEEFNHLDADYRCATRTWDHTNVSAGRRLDPSAPVYSGITRTASTLSYECVASARDGTGEVRRLGCHVLAEIMLLDHCHHRPIAAVSGSRKMRRGQDRGEMRRCPICASD